MRFGYELAKTIVFGPEVDRSVTELLAVVRRVGAEAVIVPSAEHFGGFVPDVLVRVCDVITIVPENTYARTILPSMFDEGA